MGMSWEYPHLFIPGDLHHIQTLIMSQMPDFASSQIFPVFSRYDLNMPILKIFPDIPIPIPVSASQVFSLLEMMFGQLNPEDLPSVPRSSELLMKSLRERSLERAQEGGGWRFRMDVFWEKLLYIDIDIGIVPQTVWPHVGFLR